MRTITVKGVGSASARPDFITLALTIDAQDMQYEAAMRQADRRVAALQAAATRAGLEQEALKTSGFQVSTAYENVRDPNGNYQQQFAGYHCVYRLKLAFDFDSRRLAEVLAAIAESEAAPALQIAFTVKDPAAVNEALLASAAANAREKAAILCRAAGATLGALQSVDYSWNASELLSRTSYELEDAVMPLMARKCAAPAPAPEDIQLHDSVTFVWEIV